MVVYAAYFLDGDPLGAYNKRLLAELLEHIDSHKELSIIGGDFNTTPDTMTDLLASAGSAMTVAATDAPTCRVGRGTTIDYFITDARLSTAIADVTARTQYRISPHSPVDQLLNVLGRSHAPPASLARRAAIWPSTRP